MSTIELHERYPQSRREDISDAYIRGYINGLQTCQTDNAKLRKLVRIAIEYCVNGYCAEEDECPLRESRHSCRLYAEARELGVEVDG